MHPKLQYKNHHGIFYMSNVFVCLEGGKYRKCPKITSRNKSAFLNFGNIDILGQIILYFRELSGPLSDSILSLCSLDASSTPPKVMTTQNVTRHCQLSPVGERENIIPS